jgi:hypothetical protein
MRYELIPQTTSRNISVGFDKLRTNKEFGSKLWKKIYQFEGRLFAHVWGTQLGRFVLLIDLKEMGKRFGSGGP